MTPNDFLGAETIWRWRASPRSMALERFGFFPDPWQGDALDAFAHSPRIAMKSCKGPGKSCILAILAWNFLLCYPHSTLEMAWRHAALNAASNGCDYWLAQRAAARPAAAPVANEACNR